MSVRVFNYNTMERLAQFEAHSDYIRSLVVHPTESFLLTSSDDMSIKLWDWDSKFCLRQSFEGHLHYVMQVALNPKDLCTFASASLDRSVKVWQLGSSQANFTLDGHDHGVNCVSYCAQKDRPYLASGGDDHVVRIWDYQNKSCIHTLHGHLQNVNCVLFHPHMPLIVSGSEDGSVKIWHSTMFRHENTLNYVLDRCWAVAARGNSVALGFDQGTLVLRLGREEPAVSMDRASGKVVWGALHSADIQQVNVVRGGVEDGARVTPAATKDMGTCDLFPHTLAHSPNGRFFAACGDGEYVVYTATAVLRNKAYGSGQEFVWADQGSDFAVRLASTIRVFRNFKETVVVRVDQAADGMFGGRLIAVRSGASLCFYEWERGDVVGAIDLGSAAKTVVWAEDGVTVAIAEQDCFHVLRLVDSDEPFEVVHDEVRDSIASAVWIGDCLVYTTNTSHKLNYFVGGEIINVAPHLDHAFYVLGYITSRLFLVDKELNIVSYGLPTSLLAYQTAILRNELEEAARILPEIPAEFRTRTAQFLERQKHADLAIQVTSDPEHRFELAIALKRVDIATDMANELASEFKWKQVANLALRQGDLALAKSCFEHANDTNGRFMLATSTGDRETVRKIGEECRRKRIYNLAFLCFYVTSGVDECLDVLVESERLAEAATFALVYCPSRADRITKMWKAKLAEEGKEEIAKALAIPSEYKNLFPGFDASLAIESELRRSAYDPKLTASATDFDSEMNRRNGIALGAGEDSDENSTSQTDYSTASDE